MKTINDFNFRDLFVFDLANNHQGDVGHAKSIIKAISEINNQEKLNGAIKFQFRELSTFIHKDARNSKENKHIERFLSTELNRGAFEKLSSFSKENGLKRICTPFDEASVDLIKDLEFEAIKIASCSAKDWPLINKIASSGLPIIFSTGGLSIPEIDNLVSFLEHRGCQFAIMHCVSIYPTAPEDCNLVQIKLLEERYRDKTIGWSTHEDPNNLEAIQIAYSLGARMFERHVGISNEKYSLNKYSSTPKQISNWIGSYNKIIKMYGSKKRLSPKVEQESLDSLSRGVFIKRDIQKGAKLTKEDVYFAMPIKEGQLPSGEFEEGIIIEKDLKGDSAIYLENIDKKGPLKINIIKTCIHEIKAMLNKAKIVLGSDFEIEISHHYGIESFKDTGALIINCINREYCKKLIVLLPEQNHPNHYHKLKEETFQVLSGTLDIIVDGHKKKLYPGDCCLVQPGVFHSFSSSDGCIFEEVSTTHYKNDSFYQDDSINKLEHEERKTKVDHWGRFQMLERNKVNS